MDVTLPDSAMTGVSAVATMESPSARSEQGHDLSAPPRATVLVRAFTSIPVGHPVLTAAAGLATHHWLRAEARHLACDPHADEHVVAAATRSINNADHGVVHRAQGHLAWHQLGELATAYDDLVSDLRTGGRCLPRYQTLAGQAATT